MSQQYIDHLGVTPFAPTSPNAGGFKGAFQPHFLVFVGGSSHQSGPQLTLSEYIAVPGVTLTTLDTNVLEIQMPRSNHL